MKRIGMLILTLVIGMSFSLFGQQESASDDSTRPAAQEKSIDKKDRRQIRQHRRDPKCTRANRRKAPRQRRPRAAQQQKQQQEQKDTQQNSGN